MFGGEKVQIRVFASSIVGVWAALRFKNLGHQVELIHLKKDTEALRPVRVSRSLLSPMIRQLSRLGIPVAHILEAPVLKGWVSTEGDSYKRVWAEEGMHEERWIDSLRLREGLIRACELEGVAYSEVESFPCPDWGNFNYLGIYEAAPNEVAHWSRAFLSHVPGRETYEMSEIQFPRGMESALQKILFFDFEGVKGVLENLNRQKSVLTLISRSHILINKVVEDLRTRLSEKEMGNLRALFALNPHIFRRDYKAEVGDSGLYIPQFCLLGSGFGGLPVLMHTGVREGLKQVQRLEEHLEQYLRNPKIDYIRVAEDWYHAEKKGLLRLLSWQKAWESSLWSRMHQSWALRVHQIMPGKLRDLLKSPL